jgi:DNA-binding CsgD family transcriptional regulator
MRGIRQIAGGGLPNEVSLQLGISQRTVQTHLRNIHDKLHA